MKTERSVKGTDGNIRRRITVSLTWIQKTQKKDKGEEEKRKRRKMAIKPATNFICEEVRRVKERNVKLMQTIEGRRNEIREKKENNWHGNQKRGKKREKKRKNENNSQLTFYEKKKASGRTKKKNINKGSRGIFYSPLQC